MFTDEKQLRDAINNLEREIMSHTKVDGKLRSAFQNVSSILTYSKITHDAFYPIWWDYREVKSRAKERGLKINADEAREILEMALKGYNHDEGLNWSMIDEITDLFVEKR